MSQEFVILVLAAMFLVAVAFIFILVRDVRSGNYRKLLGASTEHDELKERAQEISKKNVRA